MLAEAMGHEGDRAALRLARGCRAFAVMRAGEVAAYGWLSVHAEWIGELSLQITPAAGEAYVWNCVTRPVHRRRGHYRALLDGIVAQARAEGITRLWIGSVEHPAEKANSAAGFTPVLNFEVRKFGPIRWLRARPASAVDAVLAEEAKRRLGLRSWSSLGKADARVH